MSCARRSVTRASSCALVVHRLLCSSVCKCSLCHVPAVPCLGPPCHRSYWPYWPQVIFALLATGHIYPIGHRSYLPQIIFAYFPPCHRSHFFTKMASAAMHLACLHTIWRWCAYSPFQLCVCVCVCVPVQLSTCPPMLRVEPSCLTHVKFLCKMHLLLCILLIRAHHGDDVPYSTYIPFSIVCVCVLMQLDLRPPFCE